MSKINYADKVTLNKNPNVADVNKVKADDLNEIKNVLLNHFNIPTTNPPIAVMIAIDDTICPIVILLMLFPLSNSNIIHCKYSCLNITIIPYT